MSTHKSIRKPWTAEEDRALIQLIAKYGPGSCWTQIATLMVARTGKQCRERYMNHLDPDMKRTAWTSEEDRVILELFPSLGSKWSQYMPSLPGRSDNAIKNRYHIISRCGAISHSRSDDTVEVISGCKRSASETTTTEAGSQYGAQGLEVVTDATQERMKRLQAARELLDQRIRELEETTPFDRNISHSSPSSTSEFSTSFYEQTIKGVLGPEFDDFDFLWEKSEDAQKAPTVDFPDRPDGPKVDMLAAFDLSCYDVV